MQLLVTNLFLSFRSCLGVKVHSDSSFLVQYFFLSHNFHFEGSCFFSPCNVVLSTGFNCVSSLEKLMCGISFI